MAVTGMPTWTEAIAILVAVFGGLWRWQERKDERSDLLEAKQDAEDAVAEWKATVGEKNNELALKDRLHAEAIDKLERQHYREIDMLRREMERKDDRIAHLEEVCYRKDGGG